MTRMKKRRANAADATGRSAEGQNVKKRMPLLMMRTWI
jgi:hypothetical protein